MSASMLPPVGAERLLVEMAGELTAGRALCNSLGRGQLAVALAARDPSAAVVCHFLDLYRADLAREALPSAPANLSIACSADFPQQEFELVVLATSHRGEAELVRDLMQQGHERLVTGGELAVATDNPRDTWLAEQMAVLFDKVSRRTFDDGAVYRSRKTKPLKRIRHFACDFAFRDHGRLFRATSRPGVFSHRRVDPGARRLMEALELAGGERVLDMGCGWGAVALAAAARARDVSVLAIDSHARAIECTQRNAQLNELPAITARLSATGELDAPGTFDIVLANPPYYADFRIAELFATTGARALRPGGRILFVTKSPDWYAERLPEWFGNVQIEASKDYYIASGERGA